MTLLLAHPKAEDLGQFVEGTLIESARAAIVQHVADCDECRILVVDAAEFSEPAKSESHSWWMQIAASLILVAVIGGFSFNHFRDPLAKVKEAYGKVPNRPLEARLSGFPYVSRHVTRGRADESDPLLNIMKGQAVEATELPGDDAKTLDARGVGHLLAGSAEDAVAQLQAAVNRDPNNVKYQNDLAAALIAAGDSNRPPLDHALAVCDQALRIDPKSAEALFNRAVALERLERTSDAIAAYDHYLTLDSASSWAIEAKSHRDRLQESLVTP